MEKVVLGQLKGSDDLKKVMKDYKFLNLNFCDVPGTLQHFDVPEREASKTLESGNPRFGFDASSIRGFQTIDKSDMNVVPDPRATLTHPFDEKSLFSICDIMDPVDDKPYSRDPRGIAKRAEAYLKQICGESAEAKLGPELEFFIFDSVSFDQKANEGFYKIESEEGIWNRGREGNNSGHRPKHKEGYFPQSPTDHFRDIRLEMMERLEGAGFWVEKCHHEVATAGQGEIDFLYDTLVNTADKVLIYKWILRNVADRHGKTVTFMPKPLHRDNGSGMHTHLSIWVNKEPFFAGKGYANLSQEALWAIGGILEHAPALVALTSPTTNSYRRLVPGFEAPVNLSYSKRNRSAGIRIPVYDLKSETRRLEVRFPDPTCNPYYAFSALLMAALDGIQEKKEPGNPMDFDQYHSSKGDIKTTPKSLEEALNNLEKDHGFLLKGGVFTEDLIYSWIEYKRQESDRVRLVPVPQEFIEYFSF